MTLTLYGVTSDGTSVPIEVTDDGKLVVDTSGVSDYVKQGDDVEFGTGDFDGNIDVDGKITAGGRIQTSADIYLPSSSGSGGLAIYNNSGTSSSKNAIAISDIGGGTPKSIELTYDGDAKFKGGVSADGPLTIGGVASVDRGVDDDSAAYYVQNSSGVVSRLNCNGSATFTGDVVIGSKNSTWLIRESNGVAMLIEQTRRGARELREFEKVRDLPNELDLVEAALNEVMSRLKMVPPAGWPVWDGQSEVTTDNDIA